MILRRLIMTQTSLLKLFVILFCLLLLNACRQPAEPIAQQTSALRISMEGDPQTLDPRLVRDLSTTTVIHTLYEGLMRTQADGQPAPALAEKLSVSPDK